MSGKKLGVLTFPISEAGTVPLSQLIDILSLRSDRIHLLTGDQGYVHFKEDFRVDAHDLGHINSINPLSRVRHYLLTQLAMAYWIIKLADEVDE
jgi:hypothetical protein